MKLNKEQMKQVFKYKDDDEELNLIFARTSYVSNDTPAIVIISVVNNELDEMWSPFTINLEDYGMLNTNKWIAVDHILMDEMFKPIVDKFIEMYGTGKTKEIEYGYAKSIMIELKGDLDIINLMEQDKEEN